MMAKRELVRSFAVAVSLACAAPTVTGCVAAAVGAGAAVGIGAVKYKQGALDGTASATVPATQQATMDAMERLGLPVTSQRGDAATARVESRYSDGKNVSVDLERKGPSVTEVAIRVGTWGDQSRSEQLMNQINRELERQTTTGSSTND